jgi:fused signal recognition particle receptor
MGMDLVYIGIAIAVLAGIILLLRRASQKSRENTGRAVQERLRDAMGDEEVARPARRPAAKPGAKPGAKPDRKSPVPTKRRRQDEDEDEEEDEDDEQEAVAVKPGPKPSEKPAKKPAAPQPAPKPADDVATAEALKGGLAKTRGGFVSRLGQLFAKKQFDQEVLDEIEQVLFTADIGPRTAGKLLDAIKSQLSKDQLTDPALIWSKIREASATILEVQAKPVDVTAHKPFVLLTIGVNGVGKTTTIGKLAAKLTGEGKKVLLAAGDTFRAAATEQLEIWAQRAGADIVKGKAGGDPSSVIYDAIRRGVAESYDVVICDTAGRLHTKVDLMDELKKVGRVCEKAMPGAPHQTWLVLDATTGQNAIQQAQLFKAAMQITGIVLTKLDGTAKGGVILGICDELKVPVRYIGIGERVEDLRSFDPSAFVEALYEDASGAEAA